MHLIQGITDYRGSRACVRALARRSFACTLPPLLCFASRHCDVALLRSYHGDVCFVFFIAIILASGLQPRLWTKRCDRRAGSLSSGCWKKKVPDFNSRSRSLNWCVRPAMAEVKFSTAGRGKKSPLNFAARSRFVLFTVLHPVILLCRHTWTKLTADCPFPDLRGMQFKRIISCLVPCPHIDDDGVAKTLTPCCCCFTLKSNNLTPQ